MHSPVEIYPVRPREEKGVISVVIPVKNTAIPQLFITQIRGHWRGWGGSEINSAFKLFHYKAPLVGFLTCIMS